MAKRLFDFFFSLLALTFLWPIMLVILLVVWLELPTTSPIFKQKRIGKSGEPFLLYKFRSMRTGSQKQGAITIGNKDNRITPVGVFIRRYKLDELPQLFNIVFGQMSIVGPRPEVEEYVSLYSQEQRKVLDVRPGLTDFASIKYVNENELLAQQQNPKEYYQNVIVPDKVKLGIDYVNQSSIATDLRIIWQTIASILK